MAFLIELYFKALKFLVVFLLGSMVFLVLGNVILRYGFNSGITTSEELSRWAFLWLTFTGAIVALREHTHLGLDTVVSRLPAMGKKICFVLSHLIMLYCTYLFADGSWKQTVINIGVEAPASGLSSGFYYGVGLFFCVPVAIILIYELYMMLTGQLQEGQLISVKESEEELEEDALEELHHEMEREANALKDNHNQKSGTP